MKNLLYCLICCLAVLGFTSVSAQAAIPKNLPQEAMPYNGHYYCRYDIDTDWDEAEAYCESLGGHLAVITSEGENNHCLALLQGRFYDAYWLGASISNSGWEWITGEKFDYKDFWYDEPNEAENGMVLQFWWRGSGWGWDDTWNSGDKGNGERLQGFICEWGDDIADKKVINESHISEAYDEYFTYSATFSDSYFKGKNSKKKANSGLTKLSALGAMSTYCSDSEDDAVAFLTKCGFSDVKKMFSADGTKSGHSSQNDNNHGTIYCGWRDVSTGRLFAFVVSGYSKGGYEWISNFNLGSGSLHSGFNTAAKEMTKLAYKYMEDHAKKGKTNKVWIMGHSRGGALTNLLAIKLFEKADKQNATVKLSKDDIYAYGFATPQYTTKKIKGYGDCIYNFVSPHDFVPNVAPSSWGYQRAGTTFIFSNEKAMKQYFFLYTGKLYEGYSEKQMKKLIAAFEKFGKDQKSYVNGYKAANPLSVSLPIHKVTVKPQDYGMKGIGTAMSDAGGDGVKYMLSVANAADLSAKLAYDGKITNKIMHAHEMITYLAWIDANPKF
ncbi:MAG: hypothetical protein MJ131_10285 [Lachnospiraceae bacterium]|nr:hypothetical protein [Lachnospiraceae bacterium]